MAAPIKADIIYYCTDSDFELEFNLGGCCSMRLLSDRPKSKNEFLKSLGRAVSRSQIIFVLGSFEGKNPLIADLCAAINFKIEPRDLSAFGIAGKVFLPERSIPLISSTGMFGGCVIECGPQAIVVLTDDRNLRRSIMRELIHEYVRDFERNLRKNIPVKSNASGDIKSSSGNDSRIMDGAYPYVLEETKENNADFRALEEEFSQEHEPKKHKGIKRLFTFLFVLIFIAVGVFSYVSFAEPLVIDSIYDEYREMYGKSHTLFNDNMIDSMGELYAFNPDTVGFLSVDGTDIALPIVSDREKSENYYQTHLYNGWYSYLYGTPYTVNDIKNIPYHRNILIFGKDTQKGAMFSELEGITGLLGYHASPVLRFDSLYSSGIYKIFAAFTCSEAEAQDLLRTEFFDDNEFLEHINLLRTKSAINTTVDISANDEIITLITYGKETKTIVAARRVRAGESSLVDTQNATENYGTPTPLPETDSNVTQTAPTVSDENTIFANFSDRYEQGAPLDGETALQYTSQYIKSETPDTNMSESSEAPDYAGEIISVTDSETGERISGTALDILCRVVEAEIGSNSQPEAIKAQAIASYGWLLTNGANSGSSPTVALKTAGSSVINAVKEVIGLKPYIDGKVAQTLYFPCSAGYTAECNDIFKIQTGYGAGESSVDRNCEQYIKRNVYSADDIKKWVLDTTGTDLSAVADKNRWINVTYDQNGAYVTHVWFGNSSTFYSGRFVREKLFNKERTVNNTLASTAFKISYQPESDTFIFETRGIGHGVGMSQYGANALAKAGKTYLEILKHYYGGITVEY